MRNTIHTQPRPTSTEAGKSLMPNSLDTPSRWIVGIAAFVLVALTTWFFSSLIANQAKTSEKMDAIDRRLIAVETQVTSVHLQMVDVPNLKLEQARMDLRLKNLEAQQRVDNRQGPNL